MWLWRSWCHIQVVRGSHRQEVNGMMGSKGMGAILEVSLMGCGRGLAPDAGGKVVLTQGGHQA